MISAHDNDDNHSIMNNANGKMKNNIFQRYKYAFRGFLGYIAFLFILFLLMISNIFGGIVSQLLWHIFQFALYPLILVKLLQGIPTTHILYQITTFEKFALLMVYGVIVAIVCQLIFSWKKTKPSE